ncbi:PfkB family carbohydrate kinase [Desulfovibrio sp. TomC]|uniref:PfkB family carbohydrate kinase n=1 Tax=Desulfovibrio sp. TomC TaxID=1562888 RepID=UPI0005740670|nr:PfkB family carbohydrate kinase [Desulfovibrio sp. TomC]KHK00282.1 ADP-heptose synthase [Desulfovibrio sp. TomC]
MIESKILLIKDLADIICTLKSKNKRIVLCHGVFDLLHIGHIRYLREAKSHGDILVVTCTPDRFVDKGPNRPAFDEKLRVEALAALDVVDYAAINEWATAEETLRSIRPDVYVKGREFENLEDPTGKISREAAVVEEIGAQIAFAGDIVFSSTNLINRYLSNLSQDLQEYLKIFREHYDLDYFTAMLDAMGKLKVLVLGDTIIDEYQYCSVIGKSSKDPILAVKAQSKDTFAGGVLAVANHVANFAQEVCMITILGDQPRYEDFIAANINPKIQAEYLTKYNSTTTVKRRIVEGYSFTKLIEVYELDETPLPSDFDALLCRKLKSIMPNYDLVLVADFGHGAISRSMISTICEHAPYLAINTQANAGNRGFHTISKYSHADFVSLAEHEIRLDMRDTVGNLRPMMEHHATRMGSKNFVTTMGRQGCAVLADGGAFAKVPSFVSNVVDRVGAGDAFLSVAAMASRVGAKPEAIGFIGNTVGSLAVSYIGNQTSIGPIAVLNYLKSLLK